MLTRENLTQHGETVARKGDKVDPGSSFSEIETFHKSHSDNQLGSTA